MKNSKITTKNPRLLACLTVEPILNANKQSRSLDTALACYSDSLLPKDRALYKSLCYNLCRWHLQLYAISQQLLDKPLKPKEFTLQIAIELGLLQLFYMEIPDHAAIKESVAIAKAIKKPWATRLINGVLREAQRKGLDTLLASAISQATDDKSANTTHANPTLTPSPSSKFNTNAIQFAHPEWLTKKIESDWPTKAAAILTANNQPGPMTLRINTQQISRDDYIAQLKQAGIEARKTQRSTYGITLSHPISVESIPLFEKGTVSVQDEAAQLAGHLLQPLSTETILDACAAPGSKSTHIYELAPEADLTSNDINEDRIRQVVDNFHRLGIKKRIQQQDLIDLAQEEENKGLYNAILLDSPCSGTGVIRRHPDIKWLRRETDINALSQTQSKLLESAWTMLKPGGRLLYCTCSILRSENEQVIGQFLEQTPSAQAEVVCAEDGIAGQYGFYLLPTIDNHDGFYYALLTKEAQC